MKKTVLFLLLSGIALMQASRTALAFDWPISSTVTGPNRRPYANAGFDQEVEVDKVAVLDGSGSYDPDEDHLTYYWELLACPERGDARLIAEHRMRAYLRPDAAGVWVVSLSVSDGELTSERDVARIHVTEPEGFTKPDLAVVGIRGEGIFRKRRYWDSYAWAYVVDELVDYFQVGITNLGSSYTGPLSLSVRGKTVRINVNLQHREETWLTLFRREIKWLEDVWRLHCWVTVDSDQEIDELSEANNSRSWYIYRRELLPAPFAAVTDYIYIFQEGEHPSNYTRLEQGENFTFPSPLRPSISVRLKNLSDCFNTLAVWLVYDWTPLPADGENIQLYAEEITLEPREERWVYMMNISVPRKKKFRDNFTTLAIIGYYEHEVGYDVLWATDVKADYVVIEGYWSW